MRTSVLQVSSDIQRGGDIPLGRRAQVGAGHGAAEVRSQLPLYFTLRLTSLRQVSNHIQQGAGHGARKALTAATCTLMLGLMSVCQVSGDIQRGRDVALGRDAGEVAGHGAPEALAVILGRLDGGRLATVLPQAHRLDPPLQRLIPCVLQP